MDTRVEWMCLSLLWLCVDNYTRDDRNYFLGLAWPLLRFVSVFCWINLNYPSYFIFSFFLSFPYPLLGNQLFVQCFFFFWFLFFTNLDELQVLSVQRRKIIIIIRNRNEEITAAPLVSAVLFVLLSRVFFRFNFVLICRYLTYFGWPWAWSCKQWRICSCRCVNLHSTTVLLYGSSLVFLLL